MDIGTLPTQKPPHAAWRPARCDKVALVLQGGGALGAYQAGVYQAMHEAGLEPDWLAGVSIGGINGAIIAGNPPEARLDKLHEFWTTVTARPVWPLAPDGDWPRKIFNACSSFLTMTLGQPGFFSPRILNPWLLPRGADGATSLYDSTPLRALLQRLVDFDRLNDGSVRFAAGTVEIASGNFVYFDNARERIGPEHIMASAALPPGLPMVEIGKKQYWDGGIVSNTPLQHLLDNAASDNMLVFQVDLFGARGPIPRDMFDVMNRDKDIRFSSRTRFVTDVYMRMHRQNQQMLKLLEKIPQGRLDADEQALKQRLSTLPEIAILLLIYQQSVSEGAAKDYDFSPNAMREHWDAGYRDTCHTLSQKAWLAMPEGKGVVVHDVHRKG